MSGRFAFWARSAKRRIAQLRTSLDPENATLRNQADLLDQAADKFTGIGRVVGCQGLREFGDPSDRSELVQQNGLASERCLRRSYKYRAQRRWSPSATA